MKALLAAAAGLGAFAYVVLSWVAIEFFVGHHRRPVGDTPEVVGLAFEDVRLTAADGIELAAWVVEPMARRGAAPDAPSLGTVLVFHGLHGRRDVLPLYFLARIGLRGLAIDHRAHGQSGGESTSFGWNERLDVEAAIAYARERWPGEPLGAWGISLGAAAIAYATERAATLDAIVLEGCYADAELAWSTRVEEGLPPALRPLAWLPRQLVRLRIGEAAGRLRPTEVVGSLPAERLVLVRSDGDRMVSEAEFALLVRAAPGATVLRAPNSVHGNALTASGEAWRADLGELLLATLRESATRGSGSIAPLPAARLPALAEPPAGVGGE